MKQLCFVLAIVSLALPASGTVTPDSACVMETPEPSREEAIARVSRAANSESRVRKLIHVLQIELKSSPAWQAEEVHADLREAEAMLERLQEVKSRKYCETGAPETARYIAEALRRLEECGTQKFPEHNGQRTYGVAEAEFVVDADGLLFSKRLLKSSNSTTIDEHIGRLIQASAPFGPVPPSLSNGPYRYFVFRQRFSFLKGQDPTTPAPRIKCSM